MKYRYYIAAALLSILLLPACEKKDLVPQEYITPPYVYDKLDSSGNYAIQVLNNLYSYLPDGYNRIDNVVLGAATDDAIPSDNYNNINVLSQSTLTAISENPDDAWYHAYQAVRNVNLFLSNIEDVPLNNETKGYWEGEARFIRAMSYFELIKRYGGVPLIGDKLFSQDDKIDIPRNTYDKCVQYIVSELDDIQGMLRTDPLASPDVGRITQGAALALKSRVLLYAASPLNNPNNDPGKWREAADAAKAVMDLNVYSLDKNFVSVFTSRQNDEVILAHQRPLIQDVERNNAPVGYADPNQSKGYVSPTQELADAFPMENGLLITDPASGYNPDSPYLNRDPRFYATVFYNGSMWLQRPVETFEGGKDKPNGIQRQTRTGYYMRKFSADYSTQQAYGNQSHNFPLFRYAEILLNYAEAENELGQTNEAYTQLKAVRKRAGIKAGSDGMYGLKPGMTQDEMREAVRHERRIEMAFEEQRFWDARRWKIADRVFNEDLHGVKITRNTDSTFNYENTTVFKMTFAPKLYLYPIPYAEVSGNPAIQQNEGW